MRLMPTARRFDWRYALGEVSLIVMGVTIALAASSWYEERIDWFASELEKEAFCPTSNWWRLSSQNTIRRSTFSLTSWVSSSSRTVPP